MRAQLNCVPVLLGLVLVQGHPGSREGTGGSLTGGMGSGGVREWQKVELDATESMGFRRLQSRKGSQGPARKGKSTPDGSA